MKPSHSLLPTALVSLLLAPLSAQVTIQVGGVGGVSDIRAGLAIAQPGDELVVHPGSYAHFTDDVGVTIRAAIPGTVEVFFEPALVPPGCGLTCLPEQHTRFRPPTGERSLVDGLDFVGTQGMIGSISISNRVSVHGRVAMRDCTMESEVGLPLLIEAGSDVHLQSCSVRINYPFQNTANLWANIMRVTSSRISAVDCEFLKLDNFTLAIGGVQLFDSTMHASGITIERTGGTATFGALALDQSSAWISDSTLLSSNNFCGAGTDSGSTLFTDRSTISGPAGCVATQADGARVGVSEPTPPAAGSAYSVTYRTTPNTVVGVFAAPSLDVSTLPQLPQPIWLPLGSAIPAAALLADANGAATVTWNLPAITASPRPELWVQAISGILPFQISPVVGGIVR